MSNLHLVAENLSTTARGQNGAVADAFGRSAFNRYYYAAYLVVRELLECFDADWGRQSHSSIPTLLEGALLKLIRNETKRQGKLGALRESDVGRLNRQAARAAAALAETLTTAYSVRVIADYEPKLAVEFKNGTFRLIDHTEGEAKAWLTVVSQHKGTLMQIGRELGLVS